MSNFFLIKSLQRKRQKNVLLIILISLLTLAVIGGSLLILVLNNGLQGMEKRLGADIMVIPADSSYKAKNFLMEGSREYFYFDGKIADQIREIDGVDMLTDQFYLTSMATDCCTSMVGIVAFDPETDFIIQPWVAEKARGKFSTDKIIVGSEIDVESDNTIRLFANKYEVIYRLAETGTSLDTSVYVTKEAIGQLIEDAESRGMVFDDGQKKEGAISSIFIRIKDGENVTELTRKIKETIDTDVDVIYPESLLRTFSENTRNIVSIVYITLFFFWALVEIILMIVFYISSNARKKDYALLRVLGLSRKNLIKNIVNEIVILNLLGFAGGGLLSGLIVLPFGRYLAKCFQIAYLTPSVADVTAIYALGLGISLISGIIVSIIPIVKICRLEAYSALREEE